jgi:hypothetical protein
VACREHNHPSGRQRPERHRELRRRRAADRRASFDPGRSNRTQHIECRLRHDPRKNATTRAGSVFGAPPVRHLPGGRRFGHWTSHCTEAQRLGSACAQACPRRLQALPGGPVELPAPATDPTTAPCRRKLRSGNRGRRASGGRRWRPRDRPGWTAGARGGSAGDRRSSLGPPGRAQRCRRSVRGSGSTSTWRAGGGGLAAEALTPGWRAWGYRQRRDRPDRDRVHNRDQGANV